MSPELVRGARALLDWTLTDLAAKSGVSVSTIKRIEDGSISDSQNRTTRMRFIFEAFVRDGVVFATVDGVDMIGLKKDA